MKSRELEFFQNFFQCESEEKKNETSQASPEFLRNLITLIEARRNLCKQPCVNGVCEKVCLKHLTQPR